MPEINCERLFIGSTKWNHYISTIKINEIYWVPVHIYSLYLNHAYDDQLP